MGAQIGFLVKALEDSYNISRADVHLIGLSLGGQITGYAGQSLPGIGRISGIYNSTNRLLYGRYLIITLFGMVYF